MSDYRQIDRPRPNGLRPRTALLLVLVALAAGVALAAYGVQRFGWFAPASMPRVVAAKPLPVAVVAAPALQNDPAALANRQALLAGQVGVLEARAAAVAADVQVAGAQAGRAEALLVAFAARRALDRGQGLGYLEAQLRARFADQPQAVGYIIDAARQPLTLGDLREGLATIGPAIANGVGVGWAEGFRREIGNLVVLRREGTPSPLPEDRLERARRLLEGGQVEAARAEVARLPGAAQATNWMAAAKRFVMARRALDLLETAALEGRATAPMAPPPPAARPPAAL
ncbi:MAG TPA: hypothetical protein VFQ57_02570 [Sphingomonas sp.]|jgi:hypothetical protein|nr:hypothetical protein [Sphingomonas sp.]